MLGEAWGKRGGDAAEWAGLANPIALTWRARGADAGFLLWRFAVLKPLADQILETYSPDPKFGRAFASGTAWRSTAGTAM